MGKAAYRFSTGVTRLYEVANRINDRVRCEIVYVDQPGHAHVFHEDSSLVALAYRSSNLERAEHLSSRQREHIEQLAVGRNLGRFLAHLCVQRLRLTE